MHRKSFVSWFICQAFAVFLFLPTQGASSNASNAQGYLDTLPSDIRARLDATAELKDEELQARQEILPTRLGFATFASQNGYLAAMQGVTDHLDQKRFAPHPRENDKRVATVDASLSTEDLLVDASNHAHEKKCGKSPCLPEGFFTGWLDAFGEYAHEKLQPDVAAFSFSLGGASLGLDYNCVDEDVLGAVVSYVYTHVSEDADAGHANLNQGLLGFYGMIHATDWYVDLGLTGGYYHTSNLRNMPFTVGFFQASSTTHGWQLAPHAEIGYEGYLTRVCKKQWFGVGPFILGDWVANWEHGLSEHGAGVLNMHQNGRFCSLFRGEVGLRLHEVIKYGWGDLVFQEKGSYAYQKMFGTGTIVASLVSDTTGASFTTHTLVGAQNLGVFEFSVLFKPCKKDIPYVDLRYQGQFGSRFQSHQGIIEVGKDF